MSKMTIKVHESVDMPNDVAVKFLSQFFTLDDADILRDKGYENPTDVEKALWAAYGFFNILSVCNFDTRFDALIISFIQYIDKFISDNGGWDYFPED